MSRDSEDLVGFYEVPSGREIHQHVKKRMDTMNECKHGIIAEWCAICKHLDLPTLAESIQEDNIEIVENIRSWPRSTTAS